ncbi:uncharacterized protein LOC121880346 [Homarus americanus]|uniref:uncharacterized protein LOC121880346 n=1 Tax=Homarus americanus TaxID=6706 RepID=UPI001C453450|nr:uncharacterized protein LOC121880346 [Homarus americanus]
MYWINIGRRELMQFPSLTTVDIELKVDDLSVYVEHLKHLYSDMQVRFSDLLEMNIPGWVVDPFRVNAVDVDITVQESLIELQSDITAQPRFKHGTPNLWISSEMVRKLPLLRDKAKLYCIAFPASYLVECGFSRVAYLLSKARNRLDIVGRGDSRLSLTMMQPDIEKLASLHQPQGSH